MSSPPPPGFLPGSDQPDYNRGPEILGAVVTITVLALATVCLRIYVRAFMVNRVGVDDYAMLVAMSLSLCGMGIVIPQVMNGAGRHVAYLDPEVNKLGLKLNFISQPIYMWAIPAVKMSVGFFLMRIAPNKFYRRLLQGTMVFLMAYTSVCFLTLLLQCDNLAVLWDLSVKAKCWSQSTLQALSYANSVVNIVTDVFFAALPVPMLWNVQINARTKASLVAIMGLGVFACAAAMVKSAFIANYGKSGDFLWDSANLTIWVAVEANTGIIAACLPCLKPMFKRMLDSSRYASSRARSGAYGSYPMKPYGPGTTGASKRSRASAAPPSSSQRSTGTLGTRSSVHHVARGSPDNLSEKSILPQSITKTTVVTIDRKGGDDGGPAAAYVDGWGYPEHHASERV